MVDEKLRVRVIVESTKEKCIVTDIKSSDKLSWLKHRIEALVGIPSFLLQLYYLDECCLVDDKTLRHYHILSDGNVRARVWKTHEKLVQVSVTGNWEGKVIKDGYYITGNSNSYPSVNNMLTHILIILKQALQECPGMSDELKWCQNSYYDENRMLISLFICCFHGNTDAVERLLSHGVAYRERLPSGGEAIEVAASRGHLACCEILLHRKVRPHEWQNERSSLANWSLQDRIKSTLDRIEKTRTIQQHPMFSRMTNSQLYDSALSTWFNGDHAQMYLCEIIESSKARMTS